jgi:hypothetical protein
MSWFLTQFGSATAVVVLTASSNDNLIAAGYGASALADPRSSSALQVQALWANWINIEDMVKTFGCKGQSRTKDAILAGYKTGGVKSKRGVKKRPTRTISCWNWG